MSVVYCSQHIIIYYYAIIITGYYRGVLELVFALWIILHTYYTSYSLIRYRTSSMCSLVEYSNMHLNLNNFDTIYTRHSYLPN